jgi:phage FluMu gp28-like protein
MPKLKGEFEAFNLEIPRHQTTLDDLLHIKVVNGIPVIDKGRQKDLDAQDGKGKRHGDFAVALAMAVRASFMDGGLIEYTPAPTRADRWNDNDHDDQPGGWNGAW